MAWVLTANGVDITSNVDQSGIEISNRSFEQVATLRFRITDKTKTISVLPEHVIRLTENGTEIFEGLARVVTKTDDGVKGYRVYTVEAQDYTSLLDDDVIETAVRSDTETDGDRVVWLLTTYGTKGVTAALSPTGFVTAQLATMPGGSDGRPEQDFGGKTVRQALEDIATIAGATFYVDFDKNLHWFSSESNAAPFNLSDTPNGTTTFAYREFSYPEDSVALVNSVLVIGANASDGSGALKVWREDATSIATYGRRRGVIQDPNVTSTDQANAVGDAYLAENAYPQVQGSLVTYKSGLRAGMTVQITNSLWGITAQTVTITEVTTRILRSDQAEYRISFGSAPITLAGVIGSTRDTAVDAAIDAAGAARDAAGIADLSVGGANLVHNSSFESGSDGTWTVGAQWAFGYAPVDPEFAFAGDFVARAQVAAATVGALTSIGIAVTRTSDYWVSAWSFMRAYTSGTARIQIKEYDNLNTLLATTTKDLTAAETDWTRHTWHFGNNDQNGKIAFNASTTYIVIEFLSTGAATFTWDIDGVQVERGLLITAYAPAPYELVDASVGETQIADDAITTPKLAANAVVAGKVAAGAITADTLAAQLILASLIKTGDSGARVEIDPDGIRAYDATGELLVNIPSDGSAVYIKAELNAVNLTSEMAELRGATTIPKDAVATVQAGIIKPQAAPNLSAGYASTAFTKPSLSKFEVSGGSYDALGGADGLTPCYIALVKNTSNDTVWVYEWKLSDGTISRTTQLSSMPTNFDGGFITRLGTNWFVCWGRETALPRTLLTKLNRSDGSLVASFDRGDDFTTQTTFGRPIKTDGTSLYVLDSDAGDTTANIKLVKYNTSLVKQSTVGLTEPAVTGDFIDPYIGSFEIVGTNAWVEIGQANGGGYQSQRLYQFNVTTGARTSNTDFPKVSSADRGGLFWDGTNFRHAVSLPNNKPTIYKYSNWTWTTETPIYYVGYSWYDSNATGGTHETQVGPLKAVTMERRQQLTVTTAATVGAGGTDDPNQRRVYMLRSATSPAAGTLKLQVSSSSTTVVLIDYNAAGAADSTSNNFPTGTAGLMKNAVDTLGHWEFRGDGYARIDGIQMGASTQLTNPRAGVISAPAFGRINFMNGGTTSLPTSTWTTLQGGSGTELAVSGVSYVGGVFSVDTAGLYHVFATAAFDANGTGRRILSVTVNGIQANRRKVNANATGATDYLNISLLVMLSAGDTVEIEGWQNSGGALNVTDTTLGLLRVGG